MRVTELQWHGWWGQEKGVTIGYEPGRIFKILNNTYSTGILTIRTDAILPGIAIFVAESWWCPGSDQWKGFLVSDYLPSNKGVFQQVFQ